ncbi:MAG: four helix bundle protein [Bacteroidetes bacterium]|nr:four helix bundle protein [Bacteroidota bacterium]
MKTHKDLDVWKDSIELVILIHKLTDHFPKKEEYRLTSQICRAVVSIPSNISEGSARNYPAEFLRFLHISQGSLSELETQIIIAYKLHYLNDDQYKEVDGRLIRINAQLSGLIKYVERKSKQKVQ